MTHSRRDFLALTVVGASGLLPVVSSCSRQPPSTLTDLQREFLRAAKAGDLATVERTLLERPSLLTVTDSNGLSAFALTHLHGHRAVGDHLLTQGYVVDAHEAALAQDWERFAALTADDVSTINLGHPIGGSVMYAAAAGGAGSDIWRVYAAAGDPNAVPDGRSVSPLQKALRYRDLASAEMTAAALLSNNADANPATDVEDSPLHIAAQRGSDALTEMLIRHGADIAAINRHDQLPVEVAESAGHAKVAGLLRRHAEIPRTHSTSRTAYDATGRPYDPPDISDISLVARREFVGQSHRNLEFVQQAVAGQPRMVHSVATTSEICVEAGAHVGNIDVVDFLLENGAPYSLPTAVMKNDLAEVRRLLDEDPLRIHERGAHDFALLWYPIIGNCGVDMVQLLLERGARVEEQHFLGTTALHWACVRGPIEVVELLIDNGADIDRRGRKFDAAGQRPLEIARARDQPEIAQLLIERGAKT